MPYKSPRQRRRRHTKSKALKRYKRQLNGEDHKCLGAAFDRHDPHYPLEHFDERTWHRAQRRDGAIGKLRGNHQPKYEDQWGERYDQTINRTRRDRVAMRHALAGWNDHAA